MQYRALTDTAEILSPLLGLHSWKHNWQ